MGTKLKEHASHNFIKFFSGTRVNQIEINVWMNASSLQFVIFGSLKNVYKNFAR